MSEPPDFNTLKILYDHGIPRKITLDVDKEELRKDLIESGLDKRFVQSMIKVLGAGMTLDMDWEFLEDYDREEVQSRITRRTMLKPEVVSDVLDLIYAIYEVKPAEYYDDYSFEDTEEGFAVSFYYGKASSIVIPSMVVFNDNLYEVRCINECAFDGCSSLVSIYIPDCVEKIYPTAFEGSSSLESFVVSIGNRIYESSDGILYKKRKTALVRYPPNRLASEFVVEESVTDIESMAFESSKYLTTIRIPTSVTTIGDCVFSCCSSLTSIEVSPDNKHYVSSRGVLYDKGMKTLICCPARKQLTEYEIVGSPTIVKDDVIYEQTSTTSFIIPDSVTMIDHGAFSYCKYLESIIIPNNVKKIGRAVFEGCTSLRSIALPNYIQELDDWTFRFCTSLKSIIIPNYVKKIEWGAFYGCTSLESISIPNSVKTIGLYAFEECDSLDEKSLERIYSIDVTP